MMAEEGAAKCLTAEFCPKSQSVTSQLQDVGQAICNTVAADTVDIVAQKQAGPLEDGKSCHVFFLYHESDQRWAWVARTKLETHYDGLICYCCSEWGNPTELTRDWIFQRIHSAHFVIIVTSQRFFDSIWTEVFPDCDSCTNSKQRVFLPRHAFCLHMVKSTRLPPEFRGLPGVDVNAHDWCERMLMGVHVPTKEENLRKNLYTPKSNPVAVYVENGYLICSLSSQAGKCGRELVDLSFMPKEFKHLGIEIDVNEYQGVMAYLMSAPNFRFRFWCYSLPLAVCLFASLFALCMSIIPVVEIRVYDLPKTGAMYLHGLAVWVGVLLIYLLTTFLVKRVMNQRTEKRLALVNSHLSRFHLLAGIEYLGIRKCNRFLIHIFYYDCTPCQTFMYELLSKMDDTKHCQIKRNRSQGSVVELQGDVISGSTTDVELQIEAEDILMDHSSTYTRLLARGSLPATSSERHQRNSMCLCQYVEYLICGTVL